VPRLAPAILKTEFGAGGHAMAIIRSSDDAGRAIAGALPAGYQGHLLIEEFLGHGSDLLSVSYNGLVQEDGKVFSLAAGAHFLSAGKFYLGSHLGVGSMPADCAAKVRTASEAIGAAAGAAGYRGPLNIDFLYRRSDGVIFPLEINPRRTLGATLAEVCISLFGLGYEKIVSAVALHTVPVHRTIRTYPELRDALLRKGWLGRETPGLIVLPYMVTSLATQSVIGLAVLGVDGTPAGEALSEITSYLARRRWR
jgi:predicted ATP-grasp superfamily ATP-dependent carboligase